MKNKQSKYNSMEDNLRSYGRRLFQKIWYFPDDFIKKCKDVANEAINIPLEVKNNIKWMTMEQGLYAQVVMISQKGLHFIAENKNKNEEKFKFQGQSASSKRWLILTLIGSKKSLAHIGLISIIFSNPMTIHKIELHLNYFNFQQEIQNVWNDLSFTMMPQCSSIVRSHWIAVVSVV